MGITLPSFLPTFLPCRAILPHAAGQGGAAIEMEGQDTMLVEDCTFQGSEAGVSPSPSRCSLSGPLHAPICAPSLPCPGHMFAEPSCRYGR